VDRRRRPARSQQRQRGWRPAAPRSRDLVGRVGVDRARCRASRSLTRCRPCRSPRSWGAVVELAADVPAARSCLGWQALLLGPNRGWDRGPDPRSPEPCTAQAEQPAEVRVEPRASAACPAARRWAPLIQLIRPSPARARCADERALARARRLDHRTSRGRSAPRCVVEGDADRPPVRRPGKTPRQRRCPIRSADTWTGPRAVQAAARGVRSHTHGTEPRQASCRCHRPGMGSFRPSSVRHRISRHAAHRRPVGRAGGGDDWAHERGLKALAG
jgi:hypothetical protein